MSRSALGSLAVTTLAVLAFWVLQRGLSGNVEAAFAHAESVQDVERAMGVLIEPAVNRWFADKPVLALGAVAVYRLYYLPVLGVLVWVVLRDQQVLRRLSRVTVVMAGLALFLYAAYPLAPPRFATPDVVDLVAKLDPVAGDASRDFSSGANHLSAMPSMHVGWCLVCAYAVWSSRRRRSPRVAASAWTLPAIMSLVVVATGNHYVVDVVASLVILTVSIAAAAGLERVTTLLRGAAKQVDT